MAGLTFNLNLSGSRELQAALARLPRRLEEEALAHATEQGAAYLAREIQRRTPRSSGRKRTGGRHAADALRVQKLKQRGNSVGQSISTGRRAELGVDHRYYYPAAIELGTRKDPPQAPMRIAVQVARSAVLAIMTEIIKREIESYLIATIVFV